MIRACLAIIASSLCGCITAVSHPDAPDSVSASREGPDTFHASRGAYLFGGRDGVIDAFHEKYPGARLTDQYDPPRGGTFVRVRTRDLEMSLGGKAYGYITVIAFAALIPFYNGESGCELIYEVFENGELVKAYSYPIHRHLFVWLPVLPFSWISAITASEGDGTRAATLRFFEDAGRSLDSPAPTVVDTSQPKPATRAFPQQAAAAALDAAAAASQACRTPNTPTGSGKVKATFDSSGSVVYVDPQAPFAGTPAAECIAKKFQAMHVPAFDGDPVIVVRTLTWDD
jgi:hypothetical protein